MSYNLYNTIHSAVQWIIRESVNKENLFTHCSVTCGCVMLYFACLKQTDKWLVVKTFLHFGYLGHNNIFWVNPQCISKSFWLGANWETTVVVLHTIHFKKSLKTKMDIILMHAQNSVIIYSLSNHFKLSLFSGTQKNIFWKKVSVFSPSIQWKSLEPNVVWTLTFLIHFKMTFLCVLQKKGIWKDMRMSKWL